METLVANKNIQERVKEFYTRLFDNISAISHDPFTSLRGSAFTCFNQMGYPTKKTEDYRYAAPDKFFRNPLNIAPRPATFQAQSIVEYYRKKFPSAKFLALADGYFMPEFSDITPEDFTPLHLGTISPYQSDFFCSLNTLFFPEAFKLKIHRPHPFYVILSITVQANVLSSPRIYIETEEGQTASIVEINHTLPEAQGAFKNQVAEVYVAPGAKVNYYQYQNSGPFENSFNTLSVAQEKDSFFDTSTLTLSGQWIRNHLFIYQRGTNCESHLNGLLLAAQDQLTANYTTVEHAYPECTSNQTFKSVLSGKSNGVFNGKIIVRPDAQKTNAYQLSKNILLGDDASVNAKPQLEIHANDVKCSHGSSTGKLDDRAMFYMQSRGIGTETARRLLLLAFVNDVIQTLAVGEFKEFVLSEAEEILGRI